MVTAISKVNNVTISGLSFTNSNQVSAKQQARKAAFNNAQAKLGEYIGLTKLRNTGILQINDLNTDSYIPYASNVNQFQLAQSALQVPYGKVTVSASVEVVYSLS